MNVGLTLGLTVEEEFCILAADDSMVLLVKKREGYRKGRLEIPKYLFTAAGTEPYPVAGGKTDLCHLREILQNEYQEYEFACGNILRREGNQIVYANVSVKTTGVR